MKKAILALVATTTLVGCAGRIDYAPPSQPPASTDNMVTINKPKSEVWEESIPSIGKSYFVINNLDKDSGLINISFSGDPEKYIDCGTVESYVMNARGERTYRFPAARANTRYEAMTNGMLLGFNRSMSLDGRINLIFEEIGPDSTRVTANTRYVVNRTNQVTRASDNLTHTSKDSISFSSGEKASFPPNADGESTTCVPNGDLERDVLSAIQG
ncbi:hypothetical protein [Halomonas elongata]|uniref:hypothetical protein n=1 Tax=Halomonas elongata TaxID=2746 RepID=UPI0023B022A7|nr:hypothetical protein [Halomonas elongata]